MPDLRQHPQVHAEHDALGGLILLHQGTGQWHVLNPTASAMWSSLIDAGDIEAAVATVAAAYPDVPLDDLRRDMEQLAADLITRNLLIPTGTTAPAEQGLAMALPLPTSRRIRRSDRLAALLAFPVALCLLRLPFQTSSRLTHRYTSSLPPATREQAAAAVDAAHAAARSYPGRAACLELSLTAVLAAAARGRRLDWCFGFATDPRRFHAWVETDGRPVTHPADEPLGTAYRRILAI